MGNSVMLNGVEYAGEQIAYKDSTYELVSKVAYLIGVPLRIFQNCNRRSPTATGAEVNGRRAVRQRPA